MQSVLPFAWSPLKGGSIGDCSSRGFWGGALRILGALSMYEGVGKLCFRVGGSWSLLSRAPSLSRRARVIRALANPLTSVGECGERLP